LLQVVALFLALYGGPLSYWLVTYSFFALLLANTGFLIVQAYKALQRNQLFAGLLMGLLGFPGVLIMLVVMASQL
jgi:hypothetical protein